jgi:hypothetical protein
MRSNPTYGFARKGHRGPHGWLPPAILSTLPAILLMLGVASCGPRTVRPAEPHASHSAPPVINWSDLELTLSRSVVDDRVDYGSLLRDRRPLDRFLALVACVGPETAPDQFPDRDSRLVYALNCHNATMLRGMLELARGDRLPSQVPFDLPTRFRFPIDGRLQTAAGLRQTAERLAGDDWRVRFALADMSSTGPPLPSHVFLGDMLDAQLDSTVRRAMASPRVVRVDHGEEKVLLLWRGLYKLKDDLVRDYERRVQTSGASILNVLLEWSDRDRREALNSAVGYKVALMPSGGGVNSAEPPVQEPSKNPFAVLRSFSLIGPR